MSKKNEVTTSATETKTEAKKAEPATAAAAADPAPVKGEPRVIEGFGYRYGTEYHASVNPVKGGWPMRLELDADVELVPVTEYEIRVKGEVRKMRDLVEQGKVRLLTTVEAAKEEWMAKRKEEAAAGAVQRAQENAKKALAKAEALKKAADERAAKAAEKAKELAQKAKGAGKAAAVA